MKSSYYINRRRAIATAMSVMMIGSLAGCSSADAIKNIDTSNNIDSEGVQASDDTEELTEVISNSIGIGKTSGATDGIDKEETVYLISDASGNVQDTIVDEWLKNPEGKDELKDVSKLYDIENVKGEETFDQESTKLTWQAGGSDIYYQGHSDEEAPVAVKVTYYLDGEEISPEELAGKSGHVKIRYEYENNSKDGDVYTPFVMATGMTLDMEKFANVTGTNAKVISDGSRYIVVGYGMPGLEESLDLSGLDNLELDTDESEDKDEKSEKGDSLSDLCLEFPEYFEVEADAIDFKLGMTVTVASVETLGEDDIDISDAEDEINDLVDQYQTGMNSLVDGIEEYTDGVDQVASGVDTLSSGSDTLYSGAGTLKSGIESAASGADTIKTSLDTAYSGSQTLSSGIAAVKDGAAALSTGASSAYDGAKQVSDGAAELNTAVQAISLPDVSSMASSSVDDETKAAIKDKAEASLGTDTASYVGAAVTSAVSGAVNNDTVSQVMAYKTGGASAVETAAQNAGAGQAVNAATAAATAAGSVSYSGSANAASLAAVKDQIAAALKVAYMSNPENPMDEATAAATASATADAMINGVYQAGYGDGYGKAYCVGYGAGYAAEYQTYLTEFDKYIGQVTAAFQGDSFGSAVTNVANAYASAGAQVTLGKVGETMSSFSTKLDTLKAGTQSLADGSATLTEGLDSLKNGAGTLAEGTGTLATGASTLSDGLSQLDTGAGTLQSGMSELKSGSATLYSGTETLKNGVSELKSGTDTLTANSSKLNDGAGELKDATDLLVDKLEETEDGLDNFVDSVNSVKAAARNYKSFGGASEDTETSTKFIIKVGGVEAAAK